MATNLEYSILAGAAYYSTRTDFNRFPTPSGWSELIDDRRADAQTGFEARAFQSATQIVISYAGTYTKQNADIQAGINLTPGLGSAQLNQAIEYYLQIKTANPGAIITLTGHSLGGGLAALVGVFFGVSATVFDEAPFAQTALFQAQNLKAYLVGKLDAQGGRVYDDTLLAPLTSYIAQKEAFGAPPTLIPHANLIYNIAVQGEFLSGLLGHIALSNESIANTSPGASTTNDLHSMALLSAFLQSRSTAASGQHLNEVTAKLPDLVKMIFDTRLFGFASDDADNRSLIDHLIRHESGVRDPVTGVSVIDADAMVTRFTQDLWKIAQEGGRTLNDASITQDLTKALTALAMQKYYEETKDSTGYNKTLFTDLPGGIQFDMADVSAKLASTAAANQKLDLNEAKGFELYFKNYVKNISVFSAAESALIQSVLPYVRDWFVQASGNALVAADVQNRGAFMLGGSGSDILVGGAKTDLLVGGGGADILQGRGGNDLLAGGQGSDTYLYQADLGDTGQDTIIDRDGLGLLVVDGQTLSGGNQYGDNRVYRDAQGHTYTQLESGRLAIDGKFMVEGWSAGKLAISLNEPLPAVNPGSQTNFGAGNDRFIGGGASEGLAGGGGVDVLDGKGGDDQLFGAAVIGVQDAIALGNSQAGSSAQGDWLNGGTGDDQLVGSDARDVLAGGGGKDLLIGGAGDDVLLGDIDSTAASFTWTVTDTASVVVIDPALTGDLNPADSDTDVIYAGAGKDYAWGGAGDDVIFGETGDDYLAGEADNDVLVGEAGADKLFGGEGHDLLDGGADADELNGNEGDDILMGGAGADELNGGQGQDTYVYNRGDGIDRISDNSNERNVLRFGEGVASTDVTLHLGSLLLDLGNGDQIHIEGFDKRYAQSSVIDSFAFADGTVLTTAELVERGFDLEATEGYDDLEGTSVTDRIRGLGGHDRLRGMAGADVVMGEAGNDVLMGDDDLRWLEARLHGADRLLGGDGDDFLHGQGKADELWGGDGHDVLRGDGGVISPVAEEDGYFGGDALFGEAGNDLLMGDGNADLLDGGDGDDVLWGDAPLVELAPALHGADHLQGGAGQDKLHGGGGDDELLGGAGDDWLQGDAGADRLDGGAGDDQLVVGAGDTVADVLGQNHLSLGGVGQVTASQATTLTVVPDTGEELVEGTGDLTISFSAGDLDGTVGTAVVQEALRGSVATVDGQQLGTWLQGHLSTAVALQTNAQNQTLYGGAGADTLTAAHAGATLYGGNGNDTLASGTEGATLVAGAGDDVLLGGSGNDVLVAGTGQDNLNGGAGQDTYHFTYSMGQVVLADASTGLVNDSSVVQLAQGMVAAQLTAERLDDDLLLRIKNTATQMTVQGYFAAPGAAWRLEDGQGQTVAVADLLAGAADTPSSPLPETVQTLLKQFKDSYRSGISYAAQQQGMALQADGSWASVSDFHVLRSNQAQYQLMQLVSEANLSTNEAPAQANVYTDLSHVQWQTANLAAGGFSFQQTSFVVDESARQVTDAQADLRTSTTTVSQSTGWSRMLWSEGTPTETATGDWVHDTGYYTAGNSQYGAVFTNSNQLLRRQVDVRQSYGGSSQGLTFAAPTTGTPTGPRPDYVQVAVTQTTTTHQLGTALLATGDHTVHADATAAVVGGSGNNTIYNAGFAYGGIGNAHLIGGGTLVAGVGDQHLTNGQTMWVGDGHNTVTSEGSSTIKVDPNNLGMDLLVAGNNTALVPVANDMLLYRLYAAQGVADPLESYAHGGQYIMDIEVWPNPYFNSVAEAAAFYAPYEADFPPFSEALRRIAPLPALFSPAGWSYGEAFWGQISPYFADHPLQVQGLPNNDIAWLQPFVENGALPTRTVQFTQPLALQAVQLSWGKATADDGIERITLNLSWGEDQGLRVMVPRGNDPITGTGYRFEFANGQTKTLADLLALAPAAPNFETLEFGPAGDNSTPTGGIQIVGERVLNATLYATNTLADADGMGALAYQWRADGAALLGANLSSLILTSNLRGKSISVSASYMDGKNKLETVVSGATAPIGDTTDEESPIMQPPNTAGGLHMTGTPGNDYFVGAGSNDYLSGGSGNDTLYGEGGADHLVAGDGNDNLIGGPGKDYMDGGTGDDIYDIDDTGDTVVEAANGGLDLVWAHANWTMTPNIEFGVLVGNASRLFGNALDNELQGNLERTSNDTLNGRGGNDDLRGVDGDDTYLYDLGGGADRIYEAAQAGVDQIIFGPGISAENVFMQRAYEWITLQLNATDSVTINETSYQQLSVEKLYFADGTVHDASWVYTLPTLAQFGGEGDDHMIGTEQPDTFYGMAGNDWLDGQAGADRLEGGSGDDYLIGGLGDDTYLFNLGGGTDNIIENIDGGNDRVVFGPGVDVADISAERSNFVVKLKINGTDSITVTETASLQLGVESFAFADGTVHDASWVYTLPTPAQYGSEDDDNMIGTAQPDTFYGLGGNDWLDGQAGADRLEGGSGDDHLTGGFGNDTYLFNLGSGTDRIIEDLDGGIDNLVFGLGINEADISAERADFGIKLKINGTDSVTINEASYLQLGIESFTFADGTVRDANWVYNLPMPNSAAYGSVYVDESQIANYTLTAGSELIDEDGVGIISYQWSADGVDVLGANSDTFVLSADQIGKAINVRAHFIDGRNHAEYVADERTYFLGDALNNVLNGTTGWDSLFGGLGADTMAGGVESDFYYVDNIGDQVVEYFGAGDYDYIQTSVNFTLAANVENGELTGAATALVGNNSNNFLYANTLASTLTGGKGDDTYFVNGVSDKVVEKANEGIDTVYSASTFVLAANAENLQLYGEGDIDATGNTAANNLTGTGAANRLNGGAGDDLLMGLGGDDRLTGGTGGDQMIGGEGDDLYEVDNTLDSVAEDADQGIDIVEAAVTFALGAHVENLILTGLVAIDGHGNELDNDLQGNDAANLLTGGAGNDMLFGKKGADVLIGGTGNDTYLFEDDVDAIVEDAGEASGRDLVVSRQTFVLAANVEDGILLGTAVSITGNELSNVLSGNAAANVIDGGAGADVLLGGKGNDLYRVDSQGDTVVEDAAQGVDTVESAVNYSLADNLEHLTLNGNAEAGMGNVANNTLTGNAVSNKLWGLEGNDTLDGGLGADILLGGVGNDKYHVDSASDLVVENLAEGTDTVYASVSYALAANAENLVLTGNDDINAVGNALNNRLEGNAGANIFFGGAGNDTYVFGRGAGQDIIVNFDAGKPSSDSVLLGAGISGADITLARRGADLLLRINGSSDQLTVASYFANAGVGNHALEKIRFADGTSLNHAAVLAITAQEPGDSDAQGLAPAILAGTPTSLFDAPDVSATKVSDAEFAPANVAEAIAAARTRFEQGLHNLRYNVDETASLTRAEFTQRRALPLLWNLQDAWLDLDLAKNADGRFTADISIDSRALRDLGLGIAVLGATYGIDGQLNQVAKPASVQQFDLAHLQ